MKLCNKPFSRQVTPCVTLNQNHPVKHAVIIAARHVHSPQGLDPKCSQCLFLEFSTSHVTSPEGLQKDKKVVDLTGSKVVFSHQLFLAPPLASIVEMTFN